jgi:hypothetical protein
MGYALRTVRYRYVEWRKRGDGTVVARELYDHDTDPNESTNLANDPAHKERITQLATQLAEGWKGNLPPKK